MVCSSYHDSRAICHRRSFQPHLFLPRSFLQSSPSLPSRPLSSSLYPDLSIIKLLSQGFVFLDPFFSDYRLIVTLPSIWEMPLGAGLRQATKARWHVDHTACSGFSGYASHQQRGLLGKSDRSRALWLVGSPNCRLKRQGRRRCAVDPE